VGSSIKKIWIDLENSPHIPFFRPIIEELSKKGFTVVLSARDCSQTCGLADRNGLRYERIGRHWGKNNIFKVLGLLVRTLQLMPFALKEKPALSLSHGSRAQLVLSRLLRIPSVLIFDYEFVQLIFQKPTWVILPEVVPAEAIKYDQHRILKYPGIKEDVYVPTFSPDPLILEELGIDGKDMIITIRPPATEAHYFKPESDVLFNATIDHFGQLDDVRMILLPRNSNQEISIREKWPDLISKGRLIIPDHVIDGLNLIWHSDFVISGGGTMNREAAALGVPVYSIFRGKIGAVDKYLAKNGRLILLESVADIKDKVSLVKRVHPTETGVNGNRTLDSIVGTIISVMDGDEKKVSETFLLTNKN
jgi:predicted glycosyltransferase